MRPLPLLLVYFLFSACNSQRSTASSTPNPEFYSYYISGNHADATPAEPAPGGALLIGGGDIPDSVFEAFLERARGGDVVVLRASGADYLHATFDRLANLDSIETFVFHDRKASEDPYLLEKLSNAEAIYIAGGDQSNYLNYWRDTKVQTILNEAIAKGVTIAGTSAGLAIMGEYIYTGQTGSVRSPTALQNPYDETVSLGPKLLEIPQLSGFITETHFAQRDRLGRLISFLARITIEHNPRKPLRGIAIDEQTAVLLETTNPDATLPLGDGKVYGSGNAYLVLTPSHAPELCQQNMPLSYSDITVERFENGVTLKFDDGLQDTEQNPTDSYSLHVRDGEIVTTSQALYSN